MAFTVEDYHDLVRLLTEHPEWKAELRHLVLSDELLALPELVRELTLAQRRTEERLDAVAETVQQLAQAQQRTEERLNALVEAQQQIEERLSRLETTVQNLIEQVRALSHQVAALTESQQRTADTVGGLKGRLLEITYREKVYGYFGHLLRRVKVVDLSTIDDALEAALAPSEFRDVFRLDLLVNGQLRKATETTELWLAVEISGVVDGNDVDRAWRRAGLLRRAGYHAVPVAAGEEVTMGAEKAARDQNVVLMQDGHVRFWEEALSTWGNTLTD